MHVVNKVHVTPHRNSKIACLTIVKVNEFVLNGLNHFDLEKREGWQVIAQAKPNIV